MTYGTDAYGTGTYGGFAVAQAKVDQAVEQAATYEDLAAVARVVVEDAREAIDRFVADASAELAAQVAAEVIPKASRPPAKDPGDSQSTWVNRTILAVLLVAELEGYLSGLDDDSWRENLQLHAIAVALTILIIFGRGHGGSTRG